MLTPYTEEIIGHQQNLFRSKTCEF
jgi:hypothetical protein